MQIKEKVRIEALKLGYSQPNLLKPKQTLIQLLKEQRLSLTFNNAYDFLNKNRHFIDEKTYLYWIKIADRELKK